MDAYIISGSIAAPLLIFVIYTYLRFKRIRSHPAGLMFARTLADTGFIFSTLLLSAVVQDIEDNDSYIICSAWGPLIAFFFMTSQFYFVGMCYDLYITCTFPLRSVSYTARKVHICAWSLSALISILFSIVNSNQSSGYHSENGICFLGINRAHIVQEWITFLGPYLIGILTGLYSLIFVFFRLRHGLGEVFEHANIMVKDHLIHFCLYTILGIAWFILLLETLDQGGISFAVSFIIVGTAAIDCTTWVLQKFKLRKYRPTYLSEKLMKDNDYEINEDVMIDYLDKNLSLSSVGNMSSVLRLELIRNMCSGVTQSLDHFTHNREYNDTNMDNNNITALHFAPSTSISRMKKNSALEKECIDNQCIHRFLMASNSSNIDFIEYCPHVFKFMRKNCFDTDEAEYSKSFFVSNSSMDELSAKFSEGKSGAFFFMTPNSQYLVKTLKQSEATTFLKILPGYFEHCRKFPNSFITSFYGLYGIKLYGTRLYFTIMKNIFVSNLPPHEKYDIKGSWVNRHTKHHIELGKLMKDEDLKKTVLIPTVKSKKAWEQMSWDTRFLRNLNIMDYSLLLGIYYIGISTQNNYWSFNPNATPSGSYAPPPVPPPVNEEKEELKRQELKEGDYGTQISDKSAFLDLNTMTAMKKEISKLPQAKSSNTLRRRAFTAGTGLAQLSQHPSAFTAGMIEGPGFYIMGIIDILQEYNWEKKLERIWKVMIQCIDGYGISCIEPNLYRKRFLAKMLQIGIGRGDKISRD